MTLQAPTLGTTDGSANRGTQRWRRWSGAHVVALGAGLVAATANWMVLSGDPPTSSIVLARSDLAAGERIAASDLVQREVSDDSDTLRGLLAEVPREAVIVRTDVPAGAPLRASDLIPAAASAAWGRRMSLPVPLEQAVGGDISVGDRVDVLAATEDGVWQVGAALPVVAVSAPQDRGFGALGSFHVTVEVHAREARCLVEALHLGDVHLVLATGAEPQPAPDCQYR